MSGLSQQQIGHLNQLIDKRWAREFSEIRSLIADMGERPPDTSDEALLHSLSAIDAAQVRQNVQDVQDIVAARQRIATGKYGVCTDCGSDIGYERLLAYPTAKRCINCQRGHEERKARSAGRPA